MDGTQYNDASNHTQGMEVRNKAILAVLITAFICGGFVFSINQNKQNQIRELEADLEKKELIVNGLYNLNDDNISEIMEEFQANGIAVNSELTDNCVSLTTNCERCMTSIMDYVCFGYYFLDDENRKMITKDWALEIITNGSEALEKIRISGDFLSQYLTSDDASVYDAICVRAYLSEIQKRYNENTIKDLLKDYAFNEYGITEEQIEEWNLQ
ncbi:hypothetical protein QYZ88_010340 [Lachnospiraceae bacterium C1.1]|nr:hypothetical protein [Lachnospiraceae bacterium C1.1]